MKNKNNLGVVLAIIAVVFLVNLLLNWFTLKNIIVAGFPYGDVASDGIHGKIFMVPICLLTGISVVGVLLAIFNVLGATSFHPKAVVGLIAVPLIFYLIGFGKILFSYGPDSIGIGLSLALILSVASLVMICANNRGKSTASG